MQFAMLSAAFRRREIEGMPGDAASDDAQLGRADAAAGENRANKKTGVARHDFHAWRRRKRF
jgi:hypothetical protein